MTFISIETRVKHNSYAHEKYEDGNFLSYRRNSWKWTRVKPLRSQKDKNIETGSYSKKDCKILESPMGWKRM